MRLRHIEIFNAVMLTGSVSGAARLINVSQPAVSRTLQHAEIKLGFSLFQRVRGRLAPTPEAMAIYPHVKQVFSSVETIQRLAATLRVSDASEELRVLSIPALGHDVLPQALATFRARHPNVKIEFRAAHSPQIIASLALQEADVGFLYSAVPHPALIQEVLASASLLGLGKKGEFSARHLREGIPIADLAKKNLVGLGHTDPVGAVLAQAMRDASVTDVGTVSVQTYHAALALARYGMGIAVVDACTALSALPEEVDVVRLRPDVCVTVNAVRPSRKAASVATKAFTRAVQQALQSGLRRFNKVEDPAHAVASRKRA